MKPKKILVNSLWYGIVPKLSAIGHIFVLPIVTPFLTPTDFGMIGVITAYTGIATSISSMGLHMHLPNGFYELKSSFKLLWRRILFYFLCLGFIFAFVLYLILFFVIDNTLPYNRFAIVLLAIVPVFFAAVQQISVNYYVLIQRPVPLVVRNLIGSFIGLAAFLVCARYYKLGYVSWLISYATSATTIFLLFLGPLWIKEKIFPVIEKSTRRVKRLLKISLPIIPHSLGHILLNSSDRIVLSACNINIKEIGLYTNGYQMASYINSVIDGFFVALSPNLQVAYRASNFKKMKYYFVLSQIVVSCTIFLAGLWMREIYQILIRNEALQGTFNIASILCFSYASQAFYIFMSLPVFIKKKTQHILWLVFLPGFLNIVLNIIFVPIYGYLAAVVTTLISYWMIPFISFFHSFYKKELSLILGNLNVIFRVLTLNLLLLAIVIFAKDCNIIYKILISLISIALFYIAYVKLRVKSVANHERSSHHS